MDKQYNIEDEIEIINEIINCAVDHGGDNGGAYLSCGEWLTFRNLQDRYIVKCRLTGNFEEDYTIVKKKEKID